MKVENCQLWEAICTCLFVRCIMFKYQQRRKSPRYGNETWDCRFNCNRETYKVQPQGSKLLQKQYSTLCGPELYGALNVLYQFALKSGDFTSSSAAAAPFRKMGDGMGPTGEGRTALNLWRGERIRTLRLKRRCPEGASFTVEHFHPLRTNLLKDCWKLGPHAIYRIKSF